MLKSCNPFKGNGILNNMRKERDNSNFKIICIKAPKWLSFLIRKLIKKSEG